MDARARRSPRRYVDITYTLHALPSPHATCGLTFVAFILSLSTQVTVALLASLASFLAALLTLIAFALDIAHFAFVHRQMAKLVGVVEHTNTAPGTSPSPPPSRSTRVQHQC